MQLLDYLLFGSKISKTWVNVSALIRVMKVRLLLLTTCFNVGQVTNQDEYQQQVEKHRKAVEDIVHNVEALSTTCFCCFSLKTPKKIIIII
jgi:hypothetical protein